MARKGLGLILGLGVAIFTLSGRVYRPSHPEPLPRSNASLPLAAFWAIAHAESDFDPLAIGPDGRDHGLWQFRVYFNRERGLINPFDPMESTRAAVKLFQANFASLRKIDKAISAHRRGREWVRKHGIDRGYVARVRGLSW